MLTGALISVGLSAYGLPAPGAVAFGLSVAGAGSTFVAVGAVAAQITEGAGAARSISLIVFAVFFVPRVIGDIVDTGSPLSFLSWVSPLAWTRFTRPFADEWWVFALILLFVAVVISTSYVLSSRRDLGSGLVPVHPGPAAASPALGSPLALAWRLQRGFLIGWVVAGIAVAAYELLPRLAAHVSWGVLMVFIVLELLWETGQISDAVFGVSPFAYVHLYIGDSGVTPSFFGLISVALVLSALGLISLRRRDIVA